MSRRSAISPSQMSFVEGSPARMSAPPDEGPGSKGSDPASGGTSPPSSTKSVRGGSSSKMSRRVHAVGCPRCGATCTCLATTPPPTRFLPPSSERHTSESASSWLPTLTRCANLLAPSMQKWPGHRRLPTLTKRDEKGPGITRTKGGQDLPQTLGGHLSADWCRWFMGFPVGWLDVDDESESEPSATPSSRNARK